MSDSYTSSRSDEMYSFSNESDLEFFVDPKNENYFFRLAETLLMVLQRISTIANIFIISQEKL